MNDRPKDTNGAWLFLLFFLGLVFTLPAGFVRFCARRFISDFTPPVELEALRLKCAFISSKRESITLEAQVSELSREIS